MVEVCRRWQVAATAPAMAGRNGAIQGRQISRFGTANAGSLQARIGPDLSRLRVVAECRVGYVGQRQGRRQRCREGLELFVVGENERLWWPQ